MADSDRQAHWEGVYRSKAADSVSWYRPHLETSLALIERAAPDKNAAIIDVGGGASTLVDDLLARGYSDISVLDISATALEVARRRLDGKAARVQWLVADVLEKELEPDRYDLWHDRAVFHFLTNDAQRQAYLGQLMRSLKSGGHAVFATFGPQGPQKCSGLDTARYSADELARTLSPGLVPVSAQLETHGTPFGTQQQFLYAVFRKA